MQRTRCFFSTLACLVATSAGGFGVRAQQTPPRDPGPVAVVRTGTAVIAGIVMSDGAPSQLVQLSSPWSGFDTRLERLDSGLLLTTYRRADNKGANRNARLFTGVQKRGETLLPGTPASEVLPWVRAKFPETLSALVR